MDILVLRSFKKKGKFSFWKYLSENLWIEKDTSYFLSPKLFWNCNMQPKNYY